jgi:hypothetical protein
MKGCRQARQLHVADRVEETPQEKRRRLFYWDARRIERPGLQHSDTRPFGRPLPAIEEWRKKGKSYVYRGNAKASVTIVTLLSKLL